MDSTFLNIVVFVLITILYYVALKPKLTINTLNDETEYKNYSKNVYFTMLIYFLIVLVAQFAVNAGVIVNKCGGSVAENIGIAGFMTFLPWTLIFGFVMIILIVFPGFKSAFSDVIGYFYVAGSANKVLTDLLIDTNINDKIQNVDNMPEQQPYAAPEPSAPPAPFATQEEPSAPSESLKYTGGDKRKALQDAADAIVKLCGNMSILINQIVPSNFLKYWEILTPLFKPKYENDQNLLDTKQQALLDVVTTRDNIGEAFWYIYTGILLLCIVQYNIISRQCVSSNATMQKKYQKYLTEQETANKAAEKTKATYTIKQ